MSAELTRAHAHGALSIGELSERTGVPAATLRSWEMRYGAPAPARLVGGHRRYTDTDAALVRRVIGLREAGLSLAASFEQAHRVVDELVPSILAPLRTRHPELVPRAVTKRTLLALTLAIEDECCARAQRPILFGSFGEVSAYRAARDRWRELARTAELAAVFADFPRVSSAGVRPVEIPVPKDVTLRREWVVVCDAPDLPVAIAASKRPGRDRGPAHVFEMLWTVDPAVVREATELFVAMAHGWAPRVPLRFGDRLQDVPPAASDDLRRAAGLLERMLQYVDKA